ncbi:hypothetical protein [uncultured Dokdonia sp.]|uniref:hypothetical protein n=1 Tax=uncultured Dokdonia sp. TaxID=575653 RepID=UPI0026284126|nr:hypothetical protein [uncultured Dokdonia sp.]
MKSSIPIIEHDVFTIRKLLLIIGVIAFVLGSLAVALKWRSAGSLLLLTSTFVIFGYYLLNKRYKAYREIYLEYIPDHNVNDMLHHGSFEFTNAYLNYKNKKVDQKIHWTEISSYKLVKLQHMVLFHKDAKKNIIISKTEMDASDFIAVIDFIKQHVEKNSFDRSYIKP